jgi:hypothetical protein
MRRKEGLCGCLQLEEAQRVYSEVLDVTDIEAETNAEGSLEAAVDRL